MLSGSASRSSSPHGRGLAPSKAIASSSTPSFGERAPGLLGAISPSASALGRPCTTGSPTGPGAASGSGYSRSWPSKSMKQAPSSTPPPSGRTKTPRAEKGGPTQSSGPFSRRLFDQDPRSHDDAREAALRHADSGSSSRGHQGRGTPGARPGTRSHRRLRLLGRTHLPSHSSARHEARRGPAAHTPAARTP